MSQELCMGHSKACAAIAKALGLENVRKLTLSIDVEEVVSVTAEKYVTADELGRLRLVIEEYGLIAGRR